MTDVIAVNREAAVALLDDGTTVPVTHWFGSDGEDSVPADALSCVAGDEINGWWSIDLQHYEEATVH